MPLYVGPSSKVPRETFQALALRLSDGPTGQLFGPVIAGPHALIGVEIGDIAGAFALSGELEMKDPTARRSDRLVLALSNANACLPVTPAETATMVAAGWTDLGDGLFATRAHAAA